MFVCMNAFFFRSKSRKLTHNLLKSLRLFASESKLMIRVATQIMDLPFSIEKIHRYGFCHTVMHLSITAQFKEGIIDESSYNQKACKTQSYG